VGASKYLNLLVQRYLPELPAVRPILEGVGAVADVSCGTGQALITLAGAYPLCRYVGYDAFEGNVARATASAQERGVADRVRFVRQDVSSGLPEQFDLVWIFDVVHDAPHPLALLRSIRRVLRPGGIYVCEDSACAERWEEDIAPRGVMMYASSVLYCLPTVLAQGGEGLGAAWLTELTMRGLCAEAGFGTVRAIPVEAAGARLYEVNRE
jgi:SAM-dependent methyltransferase